MPTIEVYARWHDGDGRPQKEFVSSVSSPPDGLIGTRMQEHTHAWLEDAIRAAAVIEGRHRGAQS